MLPELKLVMPVLLHGYERTYSQKYDNRCMTAFILTHSYILCVNTIE
jgi:hypothetical protein